MKICETCSKKHNGNYGSGRFCDEKCARSFSTKNKRNYINKKLSQKTKKLWEDGVYDSSRKKGITKTPRKCVGCGTTFNIESWRPTKYCGLECAYQHKERRIKQSETTKQKYIEGKLVYGGKTKWFEVESSIGLIKVQGTYEVRTCKILDKWKDVGKIQPLTKKNKTAHDVTNTRYFLFSIFRYYIRYNFFLFFDKKYKHSKWRNLNQYLSSYKI
jgi:hypothetical protein